MKKILVLLFVTSLVYGNEVTIWETGKGGIEKRDEWKPADTRSGFKYGAVVENGKIRLILSLDSPSVTLSGVDSKIEISISSDKVVENKIRKIKVVKKEPAEAIINVGTSTDEVNFRVPAGQPFVEIIPQKESKFVEVAGEIAYSILPDFFGNDVVYSAKRLKADKVPVPAENFLVNLLKGGNGINICIWQGNLSLGKEQKTDREPVVELEKGNEIIQKARIEFMAKPVYVALLTADKIWFERDVSNEPAQKPIALEWQRPFEAKWRVDFINKPGMFCKDHMTGVLSWDAWYTSENPGRPDSDANPTMSMQGLWPYFLVPAWVKDGNKADNKFYIAMYADMNDRKQAEAKNKQLQKEAKEKGIPFVEVYPSNMFERIIVYPVDRRKNTPLDQFTLTDIMREALGQEPCAYILDLEGIKPIPGGGVKETLATCGNYDTYISKFVEATRGRDSWIKMGKESKKLTGLKPGERLTQEDEKFLIEKLEDFVYFVTAVNSRLKQYRSFYENLVKYCEESAKNDKLKPIAERVLKQAKLLGERCSEKTLKDMTAKRDEWEGKIKQLVEEVKSGNYTNIAKSGDIRNYAESQDILVSFCRRAVKAIRQEAAEIDSPDPEVISFATKVREMCHNALRKKHGMEGW
jgi:hypothetical protein